MKQFYQPLKLLLFFALIAVKANAQITVDATGGTPTGSYATLKAAFDAINNGTHQGAIDIRVHANTTETAAARLDSSGIAAGALYTSVLIRPADTATVVKMISLGVSAAIVVDMNGADNVTIDGRPLGTGTSKLLTLRHSNPDSSATSMVLRLINGVSNFAVRYVNSVSLTDPINAGFGCPNINLSTSAATTGNYHVTIDNCSLTGGVIGINIAGTAARFMDSIFITNNTITNAQAVGISVNAVKSLLIESNSMTHNVGIAGWNVNGMAFTPNISGANYQVHRNRIVNIGSLSPAQLIGMLVAPSLTAPAVVPQLHFTNNFVSLGQNTSTVTLMRCFQYQGSAPAVVSAMFNTFRIGGTGTGTSGNPGSVSAAKSNTANLASGASFTFLNNLCINTRPGSTSNQHVGYWNSQPTAGALNSDYNTTWGGPTFMMAWGGFFQGDEAGMRTAAFPNEQHSTIGNIAFLNTANPDIAAGNSAKLLLGNPTGTVTSDINHTPKQPNYPYRGAFEGTPLDTNDASVVIVYTYGKIPIGTVDTVRAIIRNNGAADLTGVNVSLSSSLSGLIGSVTVDIPKFKDTTIFLAPYTPSVIGMDTLKVFVDPDQNTSNDQAVWLRENTLNALTYNNTTLGQSGNVGTNPQGDIVAKFSTPVPNFINQVNVNFTNVNFNGPWPFQVVIFEDSGSVFGPKMMPVFVSDTQYTVNGVYNLSLPSVPVSDHFYIGVRQVTANNIGFAFQAENPIRNNTFYFRQGATYPSLPWNDFAINPTNQFRFMIEPRLKINDDLGIIDLSEPGTGCIGGTNQTVSVKIQNLGLLTQDFSATNIIVAGTITSPSNVVTPLGPIVVNSGLLSSDDTLTVALTTTYDMSAAGNYSIKAWTSSAIDNNLVNDTLPALVRTVITPISLPYNQNFNAGLTLPAGFESNRFVVNPGAGTNASNALSVLLNNTSPFAANAVLTTPRTANITSASAMRFEYRFLDNFTGTGAVLGATDSISIFVSTDCGSHYDKVNVINSTNHVTSDDFATYTLPLGMFAGNDVRVKLQADVLGTLNDMILDIDNIRFIDNSEDLSATELSGLCAVIPQGSVISPEGVFMNYGVNAQSGTTVHLDITGAATYSGTATITSVNPGSTETVIFTPPFTAAATGTYNVKMYADLANDGDVFNDTLTSTFAVVNINTFTNAGNNMNLVTTSASAKAANSSTINMSGNALTIEAWVNRTGTGARTIVSKDSAFAVQYSLGIDGANFLSFNLNTTAGAMNVTSSGADTLRAGWSHVAATYDGSLMTIYINGKVAGTAAHTGNIIPQQSALSVGSRNNATQFFTGGVDELKIWNIALTSAEIRDSLHTRIENAASPNLMAYYRFDESGSGVADVSGNCNALILDGAVAFSSSPFPLGKPMVSSQFITSAASYIFGSTNFALNYNTFTGTGDTAYVHLFTGYPEGVSPVTVPGGISAVHPNYWIPYVYGNGTTSSVDITFTVGSGELLPTVVNTDVSMFTRPNGSNGGWEARHAAASAVSSSASTATFADVSNGFMGMQLTVGGNNNPLPVKLLYLAGKHNSGDVVLKWATASELGNAGFIVERSADGKTFTKVAYVKGKGTSNELNTYTTTDAKAFAAAASRTLYYRLVQVDQSGKTETSNTISVSVDKVTSGDLAIFPNPFSSEVSLNINMAAASFAKITVTDLTGRKVYETGMTLQAGENFVQTNGLDQLPRGMYMLELSANGETSIQKVLKH
jgi:hypothetical protein